VISTFDTNVLVYATGPARDPKSRRAREVLARGMRAGTSVLLLQTLAEFSHVTIRKMGMPIVAVRSVVEAWRAVLPVHAAEEGDLSSALAAVDAHRIAFWDAMLWGTARRIGVRYLVTEDLQDGRTLDGVRFINPFDTANDAAVDEALPP
jgi:predicted nucleic acid-binding protein